MIELIGKVDKETFIFISVDLSFANPKRTCCVNSSKRGPFKNNNLGE